MLKVSTLKASPVLEEMLCLRSSRIQGNFIVIHITCLNEVKQNYISALFFCSFVNFHTNCTAGRDENICTSAVFCFLRQNNF